MNLIRNFRWFGLLIGLVPALVCAAAATKPNLLGKFFVSSASGKVSCVIDGRVLTPAKGDSFFARGAIVETGPGSKAVLVFSNQTSVIVDENSRLEIERFEQEFFPPNSNLRVEPSNSTSAVHLSEGRVLISTPTLRSGTTMTYRTAHAIVSVRGEKVMIEANEQRTHVVVIAGAVTVDSRSNGGPSVVSGKRLITGEEAFLTNGGSSSELVNAAPFFRIPPPKRRSGKDVVARTAEPIKVAGTDFSVSALPDGITLTSSSRVVQLHASRRGEAAMGDVKSFDPKSITQDALNDPENLALTVAAFETAAKAVAENRDGLPIEAATTLLANAAAVAVSAQPGKSPEFVRGALQAINTADSATAGNMAGATSAVIRAIVSAAPGEAAKIAAAATAVMPQHAVLIAAVAAKAQSSQAPQIAFAVIQALGNAMVGASDASRLRSAAAIAAAVTHSAPGQAALIAGSVMQALIVSPAAGAPFTNSDRGAAIAAAVAAAEPSSAPAIVTAIFSVLKSALDNESPQVVSQALATVGAAVCAVVPSAAGKVAGALIQTLVMSYPNIGAGDLADATGLLAATLSLAAPGQVGVINSEIALASNQSLSSVQALAARSTALASQINQQIPAITRDATFAADAWRAASVDTAAGEQLVQPATETSPSTFAALDDTNTPPAGTPDGSGPITVAPFDPASLLALAADLDAAQAAQASVQFNTEVDENGSFTLRPIPTTPPTLPVELVTSPANGAG